MVLETFLLPLPSPPYVMYIYKYVNVKNNCVLWIQLVTFYKGLQSFKVYFLTCRRFVWYVVSLTMFVCQNILKIMSTS